MPFMVKDNISNPLTNEVCHNCKSLPDTVDLKNFSEINDRPYIIFPDTLLIFEDVDLEINNLVIEDDSHPDLSIQVSLESTFGEISLSTTEDLNNSVYGSINESITEYDSSKKYSCNPISAGNEFSVTK